jgi:thiol-disulfide isomerase/thioredoxin
MQNTFSLIVLWLLLMSMAACGMDAFNAGTQQAAVPTATPELLTTVASTTVTPDPPTATLKPTRTATPTPAPPTATPTPDAPLAPELDGGTAWINSEPLNLADLRGQVVLVNFWTYGCYNCQNTLPYVREWWDTYADQGLVIIGVHTPELSWEYPLENVQQAVINAGIGWPVVQDNDKRIWRAYRNRYWPRFYLVDHQGRVIYDHIGEGRYDLTEQRIVEALEAAAAAEG